MTAPASWEDERAELVAEIERLRKYAPSPEVEALLAKSSLGTDEAVAARETVSRDVGHLIVRLADVMQERDELQGMLDRTEAQIHDDDGFISEVVDQQAEIERLRALDVEWEATYSEVCAERDAYRARLDDIGPRIIAAVHESQDLTDTESRHVERIVRAVLAYPSTAANHAEIARTLDDEAQA